MKSTLIIISMAVITCAGCAVSLEANEKQLIDHLFTSYDPMVRPKEDPNQPVAITVTFTLESIQEVNEREGTITVLGWTDMAWKDIFLSWNANEYSNATFFTIQADKVWKPDMAYYSATSERFFFTKDNFVGVQSDGTISFSPGGKSTHSCRFDTTLFPFDTQICNFTINTWFSESEYVVLKDGKFLYYSDKSNEIWEIITNQSTDYANPDNGQGIVFTLMIKRKPRYFIIYVIIPLLMLAFLNVMVFRLPSDSGEKISLAVTVLLAFTIWLTMLNNLTPRSSDSIPILGNGKWHVTMIESMYLCIHSVPFHTGIFTTILMLLSAVSTIIEVHIVRIYHCNHINQISFWARRLALITQSSSTVKSNEIVDCQENADHLSSASYGSSGQLIATGLDQLCFIIISLLTILLIIACVISFIVLV